MILYEKCKANISNVIIGVSDELPNSVDNRLKFDFWLWNETYLSFSYFYLYFSPSEQNQGFNINPNIGPGGKNKSIVGSFVAVLTTIVFLSGQQL